MDVITQSGPASLHNLTICLETDLSAYVQPEEQEREMNLQKSTKQTWSNSGIMTSLLA